MVSVRSNLVSCGVLTVTNTAVLTIENTEVLTIANTEVLSIAKNTGVLSTYSNKYWSAYSNKYWSIYSSKYWRTTMLMVCVQAVGSELRHGFVECLEYDQPEEKEVMNNITGTGLLVTPA